MNTIIKKIKNSQRGFGTLGIFVGIFVFAVASLLITKNAYAMSASADCSSNTVRFSWAYNPDQKSLW
ncbi:MAG TPA: hypothetical protein VIK81_04605, partial [Patescibacteria group bacterium]